MNSKVFLFVIIMVILMSQTYGSDEDQVNCLFVSPNENCAICEKIVSLVEFFVSKNSTEEEIKNILYKICNVTEKYEETCDIIISEYFEMIFDLVIQKYNPETVCKYLNFCITKYDFEYSQKNENYTLPIVLQPNYQYF